MEDGVYEIGTKVRFVRGEVGGCHPPYGTIGTITGYLYGDNTGAYIQYPKNLMSQYPNGEVFNSYCFLELVKEEKPMSEETKCICSDCGKEIGADEEYHILSSGRIICGDCISNYEYCENCEQYVECDTYEVSGETVCQDCLDRYSKFFQCDCCGEWFNSREDDYMILYNGEKVCFSCYENEYFTCPDCDEVYHVDDAVEIDDEYYCPNCAARKNRKIHDYSYKPAPVFKAGTHDTFYTDDSIRELLFGVELEIDKGDDPEEVAEDLTDRSEDIYCKHDGSLDNGVEIVTHPCTLEYHMKSLGWDDLCQIALDHDFKSNDARTCGLHVHVGRRQMGSTESERKKVAAKLVLLVNRHWDNLVKFSRRRENQLRWANKNQFEMGENADETIQSCLDTRDEGRYQAVNLCNRNTIEFRIFNGSLKHKTINATLQFVSNLVKYAMTHDLTECMASQWTDIQEFVHYDDLAEYCRLREIVTDELAAMKYLTVYKYNVGDIVKTIGWEDYDSALFHHLGEEFVVVYASRKEVLLVNLRDNSPGWMHNCSGDAYHCQCYWARRNHIELVKSPEGEERISILTQLYDVFKPYSKYKEIIGEELAKENVPVAEAEPEPEFFTDQYVWTQTSPTAYTINPAIIGSTTSTQTVTVSWDDIGTLI